MQMSREMKKEEELERVILLQFVAIESLSPLQVGPPVDIFHYMGPRDGTHSWAGFFFCGLQGKGHECFVLSLGPIIRALKQCRLPRRPNIKIQVTFFNWSLYD